MSEPKPEPRPRATRLEMQERIETVAEMLGRRFRKCDIKRFCKAKYGINWRQVENVIREAREYNLRRSKRDADKHVSETMALCEAIIRDKEASNRDRLEAQRVLNSVFGLDKITLRMESKEDSIADINDERTQAIANQILDKIDREHQPIEPGVCCDPWEIQTGQASDAARQVFSEGCPPSDSPADSDNATKARQEFVD